MEQLSGEVDALTHRNSAMSKAIAELTSTTGGGTPTGTPTAPPSAPGAELSALQAQLARAAAELEASEQVRPTGWLVECAWHVRVGPLK